MLLSAVLCACTGSIALSVPGERSTTWNAEQTGDQTIGGRRVLRFEHDCLKQWGYAGNARQYFYVIEPTVKDNGPLLVCLHSAGGNPDKFENGRLELPSNVVKVAEAGDNFTGLMLNSGVGPEWWWGADEIKANPDRYKLALTPVENRVLATIEWAVQKYNIDRNRIYMRGTSMGGSGTLGIGMSHGDVFAALQAGVPARTDHALYRLGNTKTVSSRAGTVDDVPPVFVFFSQKDDWAKGMETWLDLVHRDKLSVLSAWGPWGHVNHYETTNPAAYEFPWLAIRKDQAYPSFASSSSDDKYPGFQSDAADQSGQTNAYFRWAVLEDQPGAFELELRLVQARELVGSVDIPAEVTAAVTPRRLQRFRVKSGNVYRWRIEQAGKLISSGTVTADAGALLTIPNVKITAKPISLRISRQ